MNPRNKDIIQELISAIDKALPGDCYHDFFEAAEKLELKRRTNATYFDDSSSTLPACPKNPDHSVRKNGKDRNGRQRFQCVDCKTTFYSIQKTAVSNTIQDIARWCMFVMGMLNQDTLEEISEHCDISKSTAFNWRLRMFYALENIMSEIKLSGTIIADDTRVDYNLKGNHADDFVMPRKTHKRGSSNTIHDYQSNSICILCAIDEYDNSFSRIIGFGSPTGKRLAEGFKNKITTDETTILVTDGAQSFKKVADYYKISKWEKKTTRTVNGKRIPDTRTPYNIQRINNYHSKLKRFIRNYRGVSSRYLPGYLLLFDFVENYKHFDIYKQCEIILNSLFEHSEPITNEELEKRFVVRYSNDLDKEPWEYKISPTEQQIYVDWINKTPIKKITLKYNISKSKIYLIRDKVEKYHAKDKILSNDKPIKQKLKPIPDRDWDIYLLVRRDGLSMVSVAKQYGLTKQRISQMVLQIDKRPESKTVKRYEKPAIKKRAVPEYINKRNNEMYEKFLLFAFDSMKCNQIYYYLSAEYNLNPKYIQRVLLEKRKNDKNANYRYHWETERLKLPPEEYQKHLLKRNQKIYSEMVYFKSVEGLSLCEAKNIIAQKYNLSKSSLDRIYYEIKNSCFKPQEQAREQEQTDEFC